MHLEIAATDGIIETRAKPKRSGPAHYNAVTRGHINVIAGCEPIARCNV
ncbi:hypothetical protein [Mesorhizobium sp. SP-1A]|nr:hypothetical protein [Mesorhizobium sp. SP-1A]